jgi:hypothetical protein
MAMSSMRSEGGKKIDEVVWTTEELDIVEKPNGPAVAALMAGAFGSLMMGILTTWAEAYAGFADKLNLQHRVGPLSGKVTFAGLAFVIAWGVLSAALWKRNLAWTPVAVVAAVLLVGGFAGTFPKFFELFAPE